MEKDDAVPPLLGLSSLSNSSKAPGAVQSASSAGTACAKTDSTLGQSSARSLKNDKHLRKTNVGPWGIAFMLFCLVSAGAFGIEEIIPACGPGLTLLLLILLPIVWARPVSAMVSECNSLLPKEGGIYAWAKETFGEFWGFQAGWWVSMDIFVCGGAYIALIGSYASQLLCLDDVATFILKVAIIIWFAIVNLVGLREVEKYSSVFSIAIIVAFAAVTVCGFANAQCNPFDPIFADASNPLECLSGGLSLAIWMYCGYDCITNMSGEYNDAKVVTKGFNRALPLIALAYILPTAACLCAYGAGTWTEWGIDGGFSNDMLGYANILETVFGSAGSVVFLIVAIFSQCAIYNTYLGSGSRCFYVLSEDHLFPKIAGKVDAQGRSPWVSVIAMSVAALFFSQFEFTFIVDMDIVLVLAPFIMLTFITWKLRKKYPIEQRNSELFVIRGKKVGLYACMICALIVAGSCLLLIEQEIYPLFVIAMATGAIAYWAFKRIYGGLSVNDPANNPIDPKTKLAPGDGKRIGIFAVICLASWLLNYLVHLLF